MSDLFVIGSTITWIESVWEADQTDPELAARGIPCCYKSYITGTIKRITPTTVVVTINQDGEMVDRRFYKYEILQGAESEELRQAVLESSQQSPKPADTREHAVYTLSDPRDNVIHYVGISKNVQKRFKQHVTCSGVNLEKNAWVLQLLQQGLSPTLTVIEMVVGVTVARQREKYWIEHYAEQEAPLANKPNTFEEFFKGYGTDEWNIKYRGGVQ
jgi:predicted GIY-YIG superfamily endonuclease